MTELKPGQRLERLLKVHGIEAPVVLSVSHEGISFRVKGTKKAVTQSWVQVVSNTNTPTNVPSYLMDKAYEFLQHVSKKLGEKR